MRTSVIHRSLLRLHAQLHIDAERILREIEENPKLQQGSANSANFPFDVIEDEKYIAKRGEAAMKYDNLHKNREEDEKDNGRKHEGNHLMWFSFRSVHDENPWVECTLSEIEISWCIGVIY